MDQVAGTRTVDVDYLLDYLIRHWHEVPNVAQEWKTWDIVDKEVFQLEWGLKDERLAMLITYVADVPLSVEQASRYKLLLKAVEENRRLLECLFDE